MKLPSMFLLDVRDYEIGGGNIGEAQTKSLSLAVPGKTVKITVKIKVQTTIIVKQSHLKDYDTNDQY